ncbi:hypothetical protein L484_015187 [Morus notabilis]|uniref:Uncharacterized protein n=1 Tax=Morus notabilis TaxID=981085 RepID=W9S375_9ROSA|nr:hypothetical protein L484_015187 [Morus notabilis]
MAPCEITAEGRRITKLDQILLNGNNIAIKRVSISVHNRRTTTPRATPTDGDEEGVRVQVDRRPNPTVGGDAEEIKISLYTRITTTTHSSARTATRHDGWWRVAADGKPPISYIFI